MEKETGQHAIGDEGQEDKLDKCTWGKREGWLIGKNAHDATPSSKKTIGRESTAPFCCVHTVPGCAWPVKHAVCPSWASLPTQTA